MNCMKCPHAALIAEARRACLACDPDTPSNHGASHIQATDYTLAQKKLDDHTPSSGVTRLAPADEDKLRKAMTALFGLDPMELLLVQHLFAGGNLSNFVAKLDKAERTIRRYTHGSASRSMAQAMKDRIVRVFPAIEDAFRHCLDPNVDYKTNPDNIDNLLN